MSRLLLLIVAIAQLVGCGPDRSDSAADSATAVRSAADLIQRSEIEAALRSTGATPLIADGEEHWDWDFRVHAQDYLKGLEERSVLVEVEIMDIARQSDGLVLSGEIDASVDIWIRLRGVPDSLVAELGLYDKVTCIGAPRTVVPLGPYVSARALNEDEVQYEMDDVPLIVEVDCELSWREQ